jgi:hypothetical protein
MAQETITQKQAEKLTLDREAGTLVENPSCDAPIGAGALVSKFGAELKKTDNAVATEMLGNTKGTIKDTIGFNIEFDNGASYRVEGNTSVGNDHEGEITQKLGTKSLALVALLHSGITMDSLSDDMKAGLIMGEPAVYAKLFGVDFSKESVKKAEALLKEITQETVGTIKGRQQASKVVISQE